MAVTMIPRTRSTRLSNAACSAGAGSDRAAQTSRVSSRLARHSDPAPLGYQGEPIAAGSEFHTAAHTGTSQFIGAHT